VIVKATKGKTVWVVAQLKHIFLLKIVSHVEEDIGDTKRVIRIRKSNKDRQNNGEK
jgi:hypothetical protein